MPRYSHIYVATVLISIVIAAVTLLALTERAQEGTASETVQTDESVPPYTPEIEAALKESEGFEFLVSYTDSGFAARALSIRAECCGKAISGNLRWVSVEHGGTKTPSWRHILVFLKCGELFVHTRRYRCAPPRATIPLLLLA